MVYLGVEISSWGFILSLHHWKSASDVTITLLVTVFLAKLLLGTSCRDSSVLGFSHVVSTWCQLWNMRNHWGLLIFTNDWQVLQNLFPFSISFFHFLLLLAYPVLCPFVHSWSGMKHLKYFYPVLETCTMSPPGQCTSQEYRDALLFLVDVGAEWPCLLASQLQALSLDKNRWSH